MKEIIKASKNSFIQMSQLTEDLKQKALELFAELIEENVKFLLEENKKDLEEQLGKISPVLYQRLELTEDKINQLCQGIRDISQLEEPCNKIISETLLDEGLRLKQVAVPLGVIGVIFESRPDVIPQILALMLKTSNACLLKGGSEALNSNRAFMKIVEKLNQQIEELPKNWATLLESREETQEILKYHDDIDLIIPRGSNQLVQSIMDNTKIPVLGHADGVCHIYVDDDNSPVQYLKVIVDSKTQYPSACNAAETILVHRSIKDSFLPEIKKSLEQANVNIHQQPESWHIEYGSLDISLKLVDSIEEAIEHINEHGSGHTDAILSSNKQSCDLFQSLVDSSSIMLNASTRFADGFRYGKGAEVGISTNKTHARGPVGIDGLMIYKYILEGSGQTVSAYTGPDAKKFKHKQLK